MTTNVLTTNTTHTTDPAKWFMALARAGWQQTLNHYRRRRAVRHLRTLDDAHLKDIGVHRSEITSVVYGREGDRVRVYDV